jgi:hypothetical protein
MSTPIRLDQDNRLIDALGGTTKTAALCEDITPQAVSQWRSAGIPKVWHKFLALKRPDVYESIIASASPRM